MADVIVVENLVKRYGTLEVVHDVSFTVRTGRTTALVGESGAGKSTIGGIVTGLVDATAGKVTVCGEDRSKAARSSRDRRRRAAQLQLVPQDPITFLDPRQRVSAALAETIALHKSDHTPADLMAAVGLSTRYASAVPREMSGGQCQRVAIARALAADPVAMVLDEAVSALDVSVQAQVLNLLRDLQTRTSTAYLFITHDLSVVRQMADDVVVLRRGQVVEDGPAEQVLDDPQADYTKLLLASTPRPGWKPVRRTA
ncbi:ABC transporter ATP-binding protein [Kibdelosporangium aridum]|uniref:ABC transporter n=1 Tax=Kibdelosporangium aridum TaxID=2030 RepID=A0A1W2FUU6_KIBAR|nr:ATP-binding cassette domain-containing protein [Kibdelosporangium aridum]SMD25502.1 ABC transporter [Kibdelosporangium aridum]